MYTLKHNAIHFSLSSRVCFHCSHTHSRIHHILSASGSFGTSWRGFNSIAYHCILPFESGGCPATNRLHCSHGVSLLCRLLDVGTDCVLETISIRLEKRSESEKDEKVQQEFQRKREKLNLTGRIVYPMILVTVLIAEASSMLEN